MTDADDQKIVHLRGTPLTPDVVLHRTLQDVKKISAIAVVIKWDDDTYDVDWSRMTTSDLCMASMVLSDLATRVMRGD